MTQTKAELQAKVTELETKIRELKEELQEKQARLNNISGRELFVSGAIYDASIAVFEHDQDEPTCVFHTMDDNWLSEESLVSAIRGMDVIDPYMDDREMRVQFRVSTFEREEQKADRELSNSSRMEEA